MNNYLKIYCVIFIFCNILNFKLVAQSAQVVDTIRSKQTISDKVKIANWYGFSKAAYSLSFDDGMISQYKYAAPILDKHGLKATFYIVSDNLESDSLASPKWRFGYWYQFQELYSKGHEIASHTATHPRLTSLKDGNRKEIGTLQYELAEPIKALKKQLPNYKPITFAYPFVDFNAHVADEAAKLYYSSRGLGAGLNQVHPIDWMNIQSHTISYSSGRTLVSDFKKIDELEEWIVKNTISKEGWTVYLAHDVLPFDEAIAATDSWHPVSSESLERFIVWLKEKQLGKELWVASVGDVTRYIKERDNSTVIIVEETSAKIVLSITDNLPDDHFNFPLTLEVLVPLGWKKVKLKQKNIKGIVESVDGKVIINVIPDNGVVEINKVE